MTGRHDARRPVLFSRPALKSPYGGVRVCSNRDWELFCEKYGDHRKKKKKHFFSVYSLSRGLSTNHVGGFGCMASTVVLRTHSSFLGVVEKKRGFLLSNCIQRKRRVGQKRHKKRENPSGWNITDVSALAGVRPFGLFLFAPGPPRVRFFLSPINNLMTRPQTSSTPFNFFLSSFFFCFLFSSEIYEFKTNDCLVWLTQVTMSDRLAAERACKDANPIIDGRKANVNLAYLGAKPRGNLQAGTVFSLNTKLLPIITILLFSPPDYYNGTTTHYSAPPPPFFSLSFMVIYTTGSGAIPDIERCVT